MPKVKYNVKGVDSKASGNLPKPGLYTCKVVSCVVAKPEGKDQRIEVQYEITEGDSKGFKLYDYVNLESEAARWKLKQFLEAMGVEKDSGSFDPEEFVGNALSIKVKIQPETDQYPASARPQTLLPLDGDEDGDDDEDLASEADDDDDGDADGDDDGDGDEATDDDDDDDDDEGEDEDWTREELEELDDDDLTLYAFGGEDEDGDEIEGLLDEDDKDDYFTEKKKGKKKVQVLDREGLINAMLEAQEGDEEDGDETPDYSSMELAELKKLAKERELSTKGSKKQLIARLEKSDEPF